MSALYAVAVVATAHGRQLFWACAVSAGNKRQAREKAKRLARAKAPFMTHGFAATAVAIKKPTR